MFSGRGPPARSPVSHWRSPDYAKWFSSKAFWLAARPQAAHPCAESNWPVIGIGVWPGFGARIFAADFSRAINASTGTKGPFFLPFFGVVNNLGTRVNMLSS
jgi:hypothetical protein